MLLLWQQMMNVRLLKITWYFSAFWWWGCCWCTEKNVISHMFIEPVKNHYEWGWSYPPKPDSLTIWTNLIFFNLEQLFIKKYFPVTWSQSSINQLVFLIFPGILNCPADLCPANFTYDQVLYLKIFLRALFLFSFPACSVVHYLTDSITAW